MEQHDSPSTEWGAYVLGSIPSSLHWSHKAATGDTMFSEIARDEIAVKLQLLQAALKQLNQATPQSTVTPFLLQRLPSLISGFTSWDELKRDDLTHLYDELRDVSGSLANYLPTSIFCEYTRLGEAVASQIFTDHVREHSWKPFIEKIRHIHCQLTTCPRIIEQLLLELPSDEPIPDDFQFSCLTNAAHSTSVNSTFDRFLQLEQLNLRLLDQLWNLHCDTHRGLPPGYDTARLQGGYLDLHFDTETRIVYELSNGPISPRLDLSKERQQWFLVLLKLSKQQGTPIARRELAKVWPGPSGNTLVSEPYVAQEITAIRKLLEQAGFEATIPIGSKRGYFLEKK